MRKLPSGEVVYSPTDLIRYMGSPFASWMDRYYLEFPGEVQPDATSADQQLIIDSGTAHEDKVLKRYIEFGIDMVTIDGRGFEDKLHATVEAFKAKRQLVYQAALRLDRFQGYADFVELDPDSGYVVWDTKLARSPKPYYIIQLCAYSEMLEEMTGDLPDRFGVILGTEDFTRAAFRLEDYIHYYRRVKNNMLALQDTFTGDVDDRPEPQPRADHGRWSSHADAYFEQADHLVRVAGINLGQIKKLKIAGISTLTQLAESSGAHVPKLNQDSFVKLSKQARLQRETLQARELDADAPPAYEPLPPVLADGRQNGLTRLPAPHHADVFFDMEGYPLLPGGLEYLFGLVTKDNPSDEFIFKEWWAHDRDQERRAFEGFVDYVYARWLENPGMHIYHYAPYEVSAVRRLSTKRDTRQDEVDNLLRNGVFVDLYKTVRQGLMIGEDSYSIKRVENLYRGKRATDVATAVDSIVQYAAFMESGQPQDQFASPLLKAIRDYNEDDCVSTAELREWLLKVADQHGLLASKSTVEATVDVRSPEFAGVTLADRLRQLDDEILTTLGDVMGYHRREDKPKWWRFFDRAEAEDAELIDDPSCIVGARAQGSPVPVKRSLVQEYAFDPAQECRLVGNETMAFSLNPFSAPRLVSIDSVAGALKLSYGPKVLEELGIQRGGNLIEMEVVNTKAIRESLTSIGQSAAAGLPLPSSVVTLLERTPPGLPLAQPGETEVDAAKRVTARMNGGCLVIQGPPGTGKTYTASRAIADLLIAGKRVGITSNSHKAIVNLMNACGTAMSDKGQHLTGIKAGGNDQEPLFSEFPMVKYVEGGAKAIENYGGGVVGGTAWLFSRKEWSGQLDFLFIDEAGQVPLANVVAMAPSATNIVLLGDQMQLEQPIQGSHPGNAGMSVLQYELMDLDASRPDAPAFYPVIPPDKGIFLGTSRRMHPDVCSFISESIYEGRLTSHEDCARQQIETSGAGYVGVKHGIAFVDVEHSGNVQRSDEEVERAVEVLNELLGRPYTDKHGNTTALELKDFLFIAPYNSQVRALKDALPPGAKVGSVDRFQGQEAPVCILSLCSSPGEFGSRGLGFILDKNRVNVAISRAQCLAVVLSDSRIADTLPTSIEEMGLLNLFCKVLDA